MHQLVSLTFMPMSIYNFEIVTENIWTEIEISQSNGQHQNELDNCLRQWSDTGVSCVSATAVLLCDTTKYIINENHCMCKSPVISPVT